MGVGFVYPRALVCIPIKLSNTSYGTTIIPNRALLYLQPELSKCSVDGIDVPVHKVRSCVSMEIKVHIYDRDGEPCSGQHLVSLCCETDEQMFTEANSSTPGIYSLSYTPSCLGEHSLVVAVNSTPINETPFNMFFLNTPHPPNCTVTVLDNKIVQRKKFDALVQLVDQNGDPVNSQQNVSAYLEFTDMVSEKIEAISSSSDSPDKYTLSLTPPSSGEGVLSVFVDDQSIASPCVITIISRTDHMFRAFKMLLIGETGSGKTSFLNLLYNCATVQALSSGFGAEGLEQFNDIKLENALPLSMETTTNDATLYNVEVGDLKVGVIDTPGFGDSRGFEQDKTNAQRIISALKKEEYINCVCLIINGRQARASASLKYVLTEITSILPKCILDNVIVVFSNTGNFLDVYFDTGLLKQYFGIEIENIFCVENPYCRLEKAKAKVGQLGIDRLTKSLQKAFEDTSKVLTEICETIKNFPQVQRHRFIELYEKKQDIEKSVLDSLTAIDNQMMLEKSLIDTKAEVKAAVREKSDNKDYKTFIPTKWEHSILCAYSNCQSNCHTPCYDFSKLLDKEMIRTCVVFDGSNTCRKCGHSYIDHYDGKLEENTPSIRVKESKKKKFDKASTDEIQAQSRFNEQNEKKRTAAVESKKLSEKLLKQISEFEDESVAGNYTKILESQLAVIGTHIEGSTGPESEDFCKTRDEVKKKLEVMQQAKKNTVYQCTARAFNLVN